MSKSSVETYSLIELPSISTPSNPNRRQMPMNNDDQKTKITESYTPENGSPARSSPARVRFLEPYSANNTTPKSSKSIKNVPSFESFEASSIENLNDLHHDGPNSVSRGLQTDISNASVIDWVLGQKSSSTGDSVFRNEQAPDLSTEKDRVRVIVRVRPVNNRETEKNDRSVVQCEGENSIL
ncbi:unnamed protein product, partial [Rotaria sp. Silwood1]